MRILAALACLATGLVVGACGAFVQASRLLVGPLVVPWGTVLVLLVLILAVRGAVWGLGSRLGGWLLFGGWLVATVAFAAESPSGDLALSAGGRQWGYLLVGVVLGAAAASVPPLPTMPLRRRVAPDAGAPGT